MLPELFTNRMRDMLGTEADSFLASYDHNVFKALRVNTLKANRDDIAEFFKLERTVPWEHKGFYYDESLEPGKHPFHEAGVYYIQEPSAMAPVSFMGIRPGDRVLDLCASPGGKSTQIAAALEGQGLLVSNEINPERARILALNIERLGIANCLVTNETPQHLAEMFGGYFDRILVDAPCSGEGMFRKNDMAQSEWSPENVQICADRQDEILDCAARMLSPGGTIVYSTCTFAPAEDEGSVSRFVKNHDNFHIVKVEIRDGMDNGRADFIEKSCEHIEDTIRLWPHKLDGEGHFAAVLQSDGDGELRKVSFVPGGGVKAADGNILKPYREFQKEFLKTDIDNGGTYFMFGDQLYLAPAGMPSIRNLKVMRPGLHIGTMKKDRFEPSHALALFLKAQDVTCSYDMDPDSDMVKQYLNGQTIRTSEGLTKGWILMSVGGYSIGWGKFAAGMIKNHYPKGLRINY